MGKIRGERFCSPIFFCLGKMINLLVSTILLWLNIISRYKIKDFKWFAKEKVYDIL